MAAGGDVHRPSETAQAAGADGAGTASGAQTGPGAQSGPGGTAGAAPPRLTCFKAYDVRGRLGVDLDAAIARRIGRGMARALDARRIVIGRDIRASSVELAEAVAQALIDEGVEVLDLGLCGTEEMYLAVTHFDADGGIEVTASHNPMDYNGMKMVQRGSAPLGSASGLAAIQALAEADDFGPPRPAATGPLSPAPAVARKAETGSVGAGMTGAGVTGAGLTGAGDAIPPAGPLAPALSDPRRSSGSAAQARADATMAPAPAPVATTPTASAQPGGHRRDVAAQARAAYVERVMAFVDVSALRPLRVLVNAGNGAAGPTFDAIAAALAEAGAPLDFIRIHHDPDGTFPNGIPNPLLPENQPATARAVRAHGADLGLAWDGDFDRCFFFDETGAFIDGEYMVGLLAAAFLAREPGARIVHDPRVVWNTRDIVTRAGGQAVQARTGHAFMKAALRKHDAVYGGEMSAHHYFRDFVHCDSGMIPWLLVVELMGRSGQPLSALVAERQAAFPSSGEINFTVADVAAVRARVEAAFAPQAQGRDETDGLSLDMGDWRFNLRASNTEPVLRLNVESRGDRALLARQVSALTALIRAEG